MNVLSQHLIFLLFLVSCAWANKAKKDVLEQTILNRIFRGYDSRLRPEGKNGTGPVVVEVNAYLRRVSDFDDTRMMISVQLTWRQEWLDERLRYDSQGLKYVTLDSPYMLWLPDLFFPSEIKGHFHNILMPNNLLRIYPDGRVLFSTRISMELSCPMDLHNYPMDSQVCDIPAVSYGYTTKDIFFLWKKKDPVQITRNMVLPRFKLVSFLTDYCTSRTNTGDYSCIRLSLQFQRQFKYYLRHTYMPTMAMVMLSWLTFWLNPRSVIIRLGIWLAALLSMIILNKVVDDRGPRVSYVKAMDVWMGTCITFVFCVLIELAFVNNAVTKEEKCRRATEEAEMTMDTEDGVKDHSHRPPDYSTVPLRWLNRYSTHAQRIDVLSRFLFPMAFGLFNCIYWLSYMISYKNTFE